MALAHLGAELESSTFAYPLEPTVQMELVRLLRTEWSRTDYSWPEAMHGDYSEDLVIASVLIRRNGDAVSTATIHFARRQPEVAVLGGVLTHPAHRGRGLAGHAIERAVTLAADAGCRICLLGTTRTPRNVYQKHGFVWLNGAVMRRGFGAEDFEKNYFEPNQPVSVRDASWGDLPGISLLLAEPMAAMCADFPRGLMSSRHSSLERCLSNFPILWYDTAARDGVLAMLTATDTGRIFGFGSVTRSPGPARRHTATIDFVAHDNYAPDLPKLLEHLVDGCRRRGVQWAHAFVVEGDDLKLACLRESGFQNSARIRSAVKIAGAARDALVMERAF